MSNDKQFQSQQAEQAIQVTNNKKRKEHRPGHRPQEVDVQSQIKTQLANLFVSVRMNEGHLRSISELGEEGVDHININRNSKNPLGYLLATSARFKFTVLGKQYSSIDNLIAYYKTHCTNEELPMADIDSFKNQYFEDKNTTPYFRNLYAVVCMGYTSIIESNEDLLAAMNLNNLQFDSYIERDGSRNRHHSSRVLIRSVKEAHMSVQFRRAPQLLSFLDSEDANKLVKKSEETGISTVDLLIEMFDPKNVCEAYKATLKVETPTTKKASKKNGKKKRNVVTEEFNEEVIDLGDVGNIVMTNVDFKETMNVAIGDPVSDEQLGERLKTFSETLPESQAVENNTLSITEAENANVAPVQQNAILFSAEDLKNSPTFGVVEEETKTEV